jgi:hypothetical protein
MICTTDFYSNALTWLIFLVIAFISPVVGATF